ncbi:MAG: AbrB/MazE/SpoVT family DNA-binding domain-containing protein [Oscillatoriaceae cyanobacterium]
MNNSQPIFLAKNGSEQVLIIPPEFALNATKVLLRKEGERLIIEPAVSQSLVSVLTNLLEIEDDFPDVDDKLLSLDSITLL